MGVTKSPPNAAEKTWAITLTPRSTAAGELQTTEASLADLREAFTAHEVGTKDGPAFIPGRFRKPYRADENVSEIHFLVLDCDHVPEGTARPTPPFFHWHFETHTARGRYRLVLPLAEPYAVSTPEDWRDNAWPILVSLTGLAVADPADPSPAAVVDGSCCNVSRFYYAPRKPEGALREAGEVGGPLLDWRGHVAPGRVVKLVDTADSKSAPTSGEGSIPSAPINLEELREKLRGVRKGQLATFCTALAAGRALTPAPINRSKGQAKRRKAWLTTTQTLANMAVELYGAGVPVEAVWEVCAQSFEAMVAEDPQGFDPAIRKADIWKALEGAIASAPKYLREVQAAREAAMLAMFGRKPDPKGPQEGAAESSPEAAADVEWLYRLLWVVDDDGNKQRLQSCPSNAALLLEFADEWRGALRLNLLSNHPEIHGGPLLKVGELPRAMRESDATDAADWLAQADYHVACVDGAVRSRLVAIAERHPYDPVVEYLERLRWDGEGRIDTALETYFEITPPPGKEAYVRAVSRKFFLSLVARGLEPGCKVDTVLVLEGEVEGEGKTGMLEILGGPFYCNAPINDVHDKDTRISTTQNWLGEMGELDAVRRNDTTATFDFITRRVEPCRPPFGHFEIKMPRREVFVATTNLSEYFQGSGRYRRFWCVSCTGKVLEWEGMRRDRDQLFAEAVAIYKSAARPLTRTSYLWWLSPEEEVWANEETAKRQSIDSVEEAIQAYYLKLEPKMRPIEITIHTILTDILQDTPMRANETRVGHALKKLKFTKFERQVGGVRFRGHLAPSALLEAPRWEGKSTAAQIAAAKGITVAK